MKHQKLFATVLAIAAASTLAAKEVKLSKADVPAPVLQTAAKRAPGATMTGFAREEEKGKTVYEVELREKGMGTDLILSPEGKLLTEERTLASLADLPAAVRQGFQGSPYGTAKVLKIEQVTNSDTPNAPTYELTVQQSGKRHELELTADGKLLHRVKGEQGEAEEGEGHEHGENRR